MSTFLDNAGRAFCSFFAMRRAPERSANRKGAAWLFGALLLLGMDTPEFPFHRKIEASPGWNSLLLPAEVIALSKPGLSDVRILSQTGEEIPFSKAADLLAPLLKVPLVDVERGGETTALFDQGETPTWFDGVELVIEESEFIKPVRLEASSDRASWKEIARSSIFATSSGVRMTTLRFPPNDRRYWRFRFDDKNGAPVTPTHVIPHAPGAHDPKCTIVRAKAKQEPDADRGFSTYTVTLDHARLPVANVRVHASDGAFARQVKVFERIWFRDEVSRRLLGEATVTSPVAHGESDHVLITEPTGTTLEVDIERTSGVALHDVTFDLCVDPRQLYFHLQPGGTAELVYGADIAATSYDLEQVLNKHRPDKIGHATLGALVETGSPSHVLPEITRGASLEMRGWKTEYSIELPAQGPIAYLDLDQELVENMRIVDKTGRQVPYVVEAELRHVRAPVGFRVDSTNTTLYLDATPPALDALELEVSAPPYFSRGINVIEELFDARGRTGKRELGRAKIVREPGANPAPLRIPITTRASEPHVAVQIASGDNAPLTVSAVTAESAQKRIDFVFESGDELRLLSGNTKASAPYYDLSLVAGRVLEAPAEAAKLGAARILVEPKIIVPPWFWIFVFAAAIVLLLALARTLTQPAVKS